MFSVATHLVCSLDHLDDVTMTAFVQLIWTDHQLHCLKGNNFGQAATSGELP